MNESRFLWITNFSHKCKEDDIVRVFERHGDINKVNIISHENALSAIVGFTERSSAARAIRSQNILKGDILKLDYCDAYGEPWISRPADSVSSGEGYLKTKSDLPDGMLVDRPSSDPPPIQRTLTSSVNVGQLRSLNTPNSELKPRRQLSASFCGLQILFFPPSKHPELQIKQYLCHEFRKFGKILSITLLPPDADHPEQPAASRLALIVFRRPDDCERAYLAYKSNGKSLYGAKVAVELCCGTDNMRQAGLPNPRNRATTATVNSTSRAPCPPAPPMRTQMGGGRPQSHPAAHQLPHSVSPLLASTVKPTQVSTVTSAAGKPPTRTLFISGLTVGPTGPVTADQLITAFKKFGDIIDVHMQPATNAALIQFAELRGASRAMTAHSRDPLRLGGRPLKLAYTPSPPNSSLWLADLPSSLTALTDSELLAKFSQIVPVEKMILVNRTDQSQSTGHAPPTNVHTAAYVSLSSPEAATTLLTCLRSPQSPLLLPPTGGSKEDQQQQQQQQHAARRLVPVDFVSSRQSSFIENLLLTASRASDYGSTSCRLRVITNGRASTSSVKPQQHQPPGFSSLPLRTTSNTSTKPTVTEAGKPAALTSTAISNFSFPSRVFNAPSYGHSSVRGTISHPCSKPDGPSSTDGKSLPSVATARQSSSFMSPQSDTTQSRKTATNAAYSCCSDGESNGCCGGSSSSLNSSAACSPSSSSKVPFRHVSTDLCGRVDPGHSLAPPDSSGLHSTADRKASRGLLDRAVSTLGSLFRNPQSVTVSSQKFGSKAQVKGSPPAEDDHKQNSVRAGGKSIGSASFKSSSRQREPVVALPRSAGFERDAHFLEGFSDLHRKRLRLLSSPEYDSADAGRTTERTKQNSTALSSASSRRSTAVKSDSHHNVKVPPPSSQYRLSMDSVDSAGRPEFCSASPPDCVFKRGSGSSYVSTSSPTENSFSMLRNHERLSKYSLDSNHSRRYQARGGSDEGAPLPEHASETDFVCESMYDKIKRRTNKEAEERVPEPLSASRDFHERKRHHESRRGQQPCLMDNPDSHSYSKPCKLLGYNSGCEQSRFSSDRRRVPNSFLDGGDHMPHDSRPNVLSSCESSNKLYQRRHTSKRSTSPDSICQKPRPGRDASASHPSGTITRLSLGMSVPMTANFHAIASSRSNRKHKSSTSHESGGDSDLKSSLCSTYQSDSQNEGDSDAFPSTVGPRMIKTKQFSPPLFRGDRMESKQRPWHRFGTSSRHTVSGRRNSAISASKSFLHSESDSDCTTSDVHSPLRTAAHRRLAQISSHRKRFSRHGTSAAVADFSSSRLRGKSPTSPPSKRQKRSKPPEKRPRLMSYEDSPVTQSTGSLLRSQTNWSSSGLSSDDDLGSRTRRPISHYSLSSVSSTVNSGGTALSKNTHRSSFAYADKRKSRKKCPHTLSGSSSSGSSAATSSSENGLRSGSSSILSSGYRHPFSPTLRSLTTLKPSGLSEDDASLDEFDRFSRNSQSTPSTEAMESFEGDADGSEPKLGDWPSCVSSSPALGYGILSGEEQHNALRTTAAAAAISQSPSPHGSPVDASASGPKAESFSRKFEEVTLLNLSQIKDESMNLSGDAIGEILQFSPLYNVERKPSFTVSGSGDSNAAVCIALSPEPLVSTATEPPIASSPIPANPTDDAVVSAFQSKVESPDSKDTSKVSSQELLKAELVTNGKTNSLKADPSQQRRASPFSMSPSPKRASVKIEDEDEKDHSFRKESYFSPLKTSPATKVVVGAASVVCPQGLSLKSLLSPSLTAAAVNFQSPSVASKRKSDSDVLASISPTGVSSAHILSPSTYSSSSPSQSLSSVCSQSSPCPAINNSSVFVPCQEAIATVCTTESFASNLPPVGGAHTHSKPVSEGNSSGNTPVCRSGITVNCELDLSPSVSVKSSSLTTTTTNATTPARGGGLASQKSPGSETSRQLPENDDLKRYVQSVIERVKAETVEEDSSGGPTRSAAPAPNGPSALLSCTSPTNVSSVLSTAGSGNGCAGSSVSKKGAAASRRSGSTATLGVGQNSTTSHPKPTPLTRSAAAFKNSPLHFVKPTHDVAASTGLPVNVPIALSIPGVNACAPLAETTASSTVPKVATWEENAKQSSVSPKRTPVLSPPAPPLAAAPDGAKGSNHSPYPALGVSLRSRRCGNANAAVTVGSQSAGRSTIGSDLSVVSSVKTAAEAGSKSVISIVPAKKVTSPVVTTPNRPPLQADPYEPNFDDDSPPPAPPPLSSNPITSQLNKPSMNSLAVTASPTSSSIVSPRVRNSPITAKSAQSAGDACLSTATGSVSSSPPSLLMQHLSEAVPAKPSAPVDTVDEVMDEVINNVCSGRFDLQSYFNSRYRPPVVTTVATTVSSTTSTANSKPVAKSHPPSSASHASPHGSDPILDSPFSSTIAVPKPSAATVSTGGAAPVTAANTTVLGGNNMLAVLLSALQNVPMSQFTTVIGAPVAPSASGVAKGVQASHQGSSSSGGTNAATISATTITLPFSDARQAAVWIKNFIAKDGSARNVVQAQAGNLSDGKFTAPMCSLSQGTLSQGGSTVILTSAPLSRSTVATPTVASLQAMPTSEMVSDNFRSSIRRRSPAHQNLSEPRFPVLSPTTSQAPGRTRHGSESGVAVSRGLRASVDSRPTAPRVCTTPKQQQLRSRSNPGLEYALPKTSADFIERPTAVLSKQQQQRHQHLPPSSSALSAAFYQQQYSGSELSAKSTDSLLSAFPTRLPQGSDAAPVRGCVSPSSMCTKRPNSWQYPPPASCSTQSCRPYPVSGTPQASAPSQEPSLSVVESLSRVLDPDIAMTFAQAVMALGAAAAVSNKSETAPPDLTAANHPLRSMQGPCNSRSTSPSAADQLQAHIAAILRRFRPSPQPSAAMHDQASRGLEKLAAPHELNASAIGDSHHPVNRTTASAISTNSTPSPRELPSVVSGLADAPHSSLVSAAVSRLTTSPLLSSALQNQILSEAASEVLPQFLAPKPVASPSSRSFEQAYPLVWQGRLSLKNAEACVALHFVQGNADLLRSCMTLLAVGGGGTPQQALVTTGGPLRIVQRMRLESAQLEAVQRKMTQEGASCACVAFASGSSHADLIQQTRVLSEGFIRYMQEKGAAGIINVGHPNLTQGLYVVHIFPPCEFSFTQLRLAAPDLHQRVLQAQMPHLLIVITTV
uniref:Protein split ends n=1 Tax=Schistocephalus solidus TaxID=70667 RepID=A0A0X3PJ99_SCHSO